MASPAKSVPRGTGIVGTLSGLAGAHKNPAKHALLELLTVIVSEELEELPERVDAADAALEMLMGPESPVNARNPYYMQCLMTFNRVAKDMLLHARGQLSSEDADIGREMFELTRVSCSTEARALPKAMAQKEDVIKLEELRIEATVRALSFYKHTSKPYRNARTAERAAAVQAAARTQASNLQARLNALKGKGGGRRSSRRSRSNRKTRRGGVRRASRTRRSSWF